MEPAETTEAIEVIHQTVIAPIGSGMIFTTVFGLVNLILTILILVAIVYLFVLLVKALRKYLRSGEARRENAAIRRSLGEVLKEHRIRCKMTQEFVAEHLGVSRQAVSKWETGTSDPSTANLLALSKLYGIRAEELLEQIQE